MGTRIVKIETLETRRLLTDATSGYIDKEEGFIQTGPSTVVAASGGDTGDPYNFNAGVYASAAGDLTSGSVQFQPSGTIQGLIANGADTRLQISGGFTSLSALDAAHPDGTYHLNVNTVHDGSKTFVVSVNGDEYPNAPIVSDFNSLQYFDPAQPQVISWGAFENGNASNLISIIITDTNGNKVFQTPQQPGASGALNGTDTATTVPGGTLEPGQTYYLDVEFSKGVYEDTTDYPGVIAFGAYSTDTYLAITTKGAVGNNGILSVTGGTGDDTINIANSSGNYVVTIDDITPQDFPVGDYTAIDVQCTGNDSISGGGGDSVTLTDIPIPATITGTGGHDTIVGGDGNNSIRAHGLDNFVTGGAGNDTLIGPGGDDTIFAFGGGDDLLKCKTGDNKLRGGSGGISTLIGGSGDDTLKGHGGNTSIVAGSGNDLIHGRLGNNTIVGGSGQDTITGNFANNTITAGSGGGEIIAEFGNDSIIGSTTSGYLPDSIYCGGSTDSIVAGTEDQIFDTVAGDQITGGQIIS